MSFEAGFKKWLTSSLAQPIPASVKAFSFNLFEPAGTNDIKFGIELIGAAWFDEKDQDWRCDEVWEPEVRSIDIPISFSGIHWEICLRRIRDLVQTFVSSEVNSQKLKSSYGIGIGFVDGDLEILWQL